MGVLQQSTSEFFLSLPQENRLFNENINTIRGHVATKISFFYDNKPYKKLIATFRTDLMVSPLSYS